MELEITQDGFGKIIPQQKMSAAFNSQLLLAPSDKLSPLSLTGHKIKALFQALPGDGFCVWFSHYWSEGKTTLRARGGIAVLELRISLKNVLRGSWEKMPSPELPTHYFQMGYTPYVGTVAHFEGPLEYQTFDIHFDLAFLQSLGARYPGLDTFMNKVARGDAAELSKVMHPCSWIMTDCINHILYNRHQHTPAGQKWLLRNSVECILLEALELSGETSLGKFNLSPSDKEGLHYVREMITNSEDYLSNAVLVQKAQLNRQKFHKGFKDMFHTTPYQYFLSQRIPQAKKLLLEGMPVDKTAYSVGYDSASSFIKTFKKKVGMPPGQWLKSQRGNTF